ncbi:MAG: ParA family protein, partial [Clostridiales bacterium]|nr:ParA family protein [Clostridiales bacterium]
TASLIRDTYGRKINVFKTEIPFSVKAKEATAAGMSIYAYDPKGKVAGAYMELTKEVLSIEKQREKHKTCVRR